MDSNMSCITQGLISEPIVQPDPWLEFRLMRLEERLKAMEKILTTESHCPKVAPQPSQTQGLCQLPATGLLAVPPAGL
jgi:hypothetical protein